MFSYYRRFEYEMIYIVPVVSVKQQKMDQDYGQETGFNNSMSLTNSCTEYCPAAVGVPT